MRLDAVHEKARSTDQDVLKYGEGVLERLTQQCAKKPVVFLALPESRLAGAQRLAILCNRAVVYCHGVSAAWQELWPRSGEYVRG